MANPFYTPEFVKIVARMRPAEAVLCKLEIYERARQNYYDALSGRRRDDPWPSLSSFLRAEVQREIEAVAASRRQPITTAAEPAPEPTRAEQLAAEGLYYAARGEWRRLQDMEHDAQHFRHMGLRAAVEADVAKRDQIHDWLTRLHGTAYADAWVDYYITGPVERY